MLSWRYPSKASILLACSLFGTTFAFAQHPVAPQLASNPGAKYTLFLNFSGFNYNGTWAGKTPGNVPAYTTDSDATTFSQLEQDNIREAWARTAAVYTGFNINVTTIDPAGSGLSDSARQTFYDNTQFMTHSIIGGRYDWYGAAGGVSYVGVAQQATTSAGRRTNWTFPENGSGTAPKTLVAALAHEDGHHLGLNHQSDESNGAGYSNNNNASGNGSYAPIMGTTYVSQRGTWRIGKQGVNANDVAVLQNNLNIGPLLDSGIGHTLENATPLSILADGSVNAATAKGWIMPLASTGYSASSYTQDVFKFRATGGAVSLTANDGTSFLKAGQADPGATMRSVLRILDANGVLIGTAIEDATTLKHTWTGNLASGDYYAQVMSYGAYTSAYEPDSRYFNMGAYFLSGSGFAAVPEPASMIGLAIGIGALLKRRKSKNG